MLILWLKRYLFIWMWNELWDRMGWAMMSNYLNHRPVLTTNERFSIQSEPVPFFIYTAIVLCKKLSFISDIVHLVYSHFAVLDENLMSELDDIELR